MVVVVRRLVRRCREVVRSIALVVHHIQATHSDGTERSVRQRQSEGRSAHNTATPETSDGLYPLSHRCLHICPNAYNGHVVQFAYRQCASRCALDQHHPGPRNGSKRYVTHCILKMEKKKKKQNKKLVSDRFSDRFWLGEDFFPLVSLFLFWRRVIFRQGWGHLLTPTGEGPARSSGV